jgi:hypothetical protein
VVSWSSKLQGVIALSTTEAEYIAAVEAGKEIKWMHKLLLKMGFLAGALSVLRIDNQTAISVTKHLEHYGRMKQLDLCYYWLRNEVDRQVISPVFVPTAEQPADILTKALPRVKVDLFCQMMRLVGLGGSS